MGSLFLNRFLLITFSISITAFLTACGGSGGTGNDVGSSGTNAPPLNLSKQDLGMLTQSLTAHINSPSSATIKVQSVSIAPLLASLCEEGGTKTMSGGSITYNNCLEDQVLKNGITKFTSLSSNSTHIKIDYINYKELRQGTCGSSQSTNNGSNAVKSEIEGNVNIGEEFKIKSSGTLNTQTIIETTKGIKNYKVSGSYTAQSHIVPANNNSPQKMDFSYSSSLVINGGSVQIIGSGSLESPSSCTASSPTSVIKYTVKGTQTYELELRHQCLTGNKVFINGVETDLSCL